MAKFLKKFYRSVFNYAPDYYDMHTDPNERLYAQLYLQPLHFHLEQMGLMPPASIVDAGCRFAFDNPAVYA